MIKIKHFLLNLAVLYSLASLQACRAIVSGQDRVAVKDKTGDTVDDDSGNGNNTISNLLSIDNCKRQRPQGAVRPSQESRAFKAKLAEPLTVRALLEARDLDGNGLLSKAELVAVAISAGISATKASTLVSSFIENHDCILNTNEDQSAYVDNQLSEEELTNVLSY